MMEDTVDELETNPIRKRTDFLTVLCILTWVGSGASVLFYGYQLLFFAAIQREVGISAGWAVLISLSNIIAPIFCVIGSIMMWKLKKQGFFIYLFGQLIPILISFYIALVIDHIKGPSLVFAILANVIPMGFIVLYGLQLKDLRSKPISEFE